MTSRRDRRTFLRMTGLSLGLPLLNGCDRLSQSPRFQRMLSTAEHVNRELHSRLDGADVLAKEFTLADLSPVFPANGTVNPADSGYVALAAEGFHSWALTVDGLVRRPDSFSLQRLRELPAHTQITRHDCVEGWSAIGQWTGVRLRELLALVEPLPAAQFVVFHCGDTVSGGTDRYYESLALDEARHPQTLLAYEFNGRELPIPHGAPLRLRVERQLGYKSAKYLMHIELVSSLEGIHGGKGGYWEDRGYEWYAGI